MSALAFLTAVEYWKQSVATLADKSMTAMTLAASPTASAMVIGVVLGDWEVFSNQALLQIGSSRTGFSVEGLPSAGVTVDAQRGCGVAERGAQLL